MKLMIYLRPKSKQFFFNVINQVFVNPYIVTYSDYRNVGDYWAGKYLYNDKYEFYNQDFEKVAYDIIHRCRTLRNMSREQSHSLALRYWNGMNEFFLENRFDYLICTPVDCYALDIICRMANRYDVNIISITGAPFYGHAKITVRGEYNLVRQEVPDEEVEEYVQSMTEVKYLTPSEIKNVTKNHCSIYKYFFRRKLIENLYYPLMKLIECDPLNYHYNIFDLKGIHFHDIYDSRFECRFKRLSDIKFDRLKTVYYPMHLVPEDTTDYWCPDVKISRYEEFVINMIETADPGIALIIKEHPAMYGKRRLRFYDELNSYSNVILLHPMDRSNELILMVDNVVVDNGTVGIEALLRGKRVISLSENYYNDFHPNARLWNRITQESLNTPIEDYSNEKFINDLLKGCFISNFSNSTKGIPASNVNQVVDGFRDFIKSNNWAIE